MRHHRATRSAECPAPERRPQPLSLSGRCGGLKSLCEARTWPMSGNSLFGSDRGRLIRPQRVLAKAAPEPSPRLAPTPLPGPIAASSAALLPVSSAIGRLRPRGNSRKGSPEQSESGACPDSCHGTAQRSNPVPARFHPGCPPDSGSARCAPSSRVLAVPRDSAGHGQR